MFVAGLGFQPPIHTQHKIAERLRRPYALVGGPSLATGIAIDDAVDDLPVTIVPRGYFPAGEIFAVKQGSEPFGQVLISGTEADAGREDQPCGGQRYPGFAVHRQTSSRRDEKRST